MKNKKFIAASSKITIKTKEKTLIKKESEAQKTEKKEVKKK